MGSEAVAHKHHKHEKGKSAELMQKGQCGVHMRDNYADPPAHFKSTEPDYQLDRASESGIQVYAAKGYNDCSCDEQHGCREPSMDKCHSEGHLYEVQ